MPFSFRSAPALRTGTAAAMMISAAALLGGCEKTPEPMTVGQKVDAAIAQSRDVAADVKVEAKTALSDAQARLNQDGPKVEAHAQDAATTAGKVIDDVAITAQVSAGLARDPELSAIRIDVDTKDGAVILRGPAPTSAARERASTLAHAVTGVVSVDNQLVLDTAKAG